MIDELREMNDAVADFFDRVERGYDPSQQASGGSSPLDQFSWSHAPIALLNAPIALLVFMLTVFVGAVLSNRAEDRCRKVNYTPLTTE